MAFEQKNDLYGGVWPSDPKHFQWKGTLSVENGTWNILAHCKPRKEDVVIKIKQTQDDDSNTVDQFTKNTKNLINFQHPHLLTPVHAFVHKSEIWVVYPRHSGGPLIEVLTSHYPNGIPDESIVSCMLYDICLGLHNLHKQQQCHRNIRASSLHIDIDNGAALLSEFGELKEIKWKYAAGRRNTFVSPDREPFTDPLILFGDESASWYAGDIYAFGITALQLTYGSPPPLNTKNILQKRSICITTDLYDKKCPFSKAFESLIRDCCAQTVQNRISINKLCEHKFFAKKAEHIAIKQYFGHILKSTEKRIEPSLSAPPSFTAHNTIPKKEGNELKELHTNKADPNKNGMIIVEPTQPQPPHNNNANANANAQGAVSTASKLKDDWVFSTTLRKSELDLKVQTQTTEVQLENHLSPKRPTMHNVMPNSHHSNDPSTQHTDDMSVGTNGGKPSAKTRNYHVSFSESESMSHDNNNAVIGSHDNTTVQINRFKVEFGSRLSESGGTVATHIEPSETNDDGLDVTEWQHGDSDDEAHQQNDSTSTEQQTIQIKRFHITPAKPELSADECDNISDTHSGSQPQPQQMQQAQLQQQPQRPRQEEKQAAVVYHIPSAEKTKWSKQELSEWVGSFGNAFKPYIQAFDDNGIDGGFMGDIDDDLLKEIVPSGLHRKRILTAWKKLQVE